MWNYVIELKEGFVLREKKIYLLSNFIKKKDSKKRTVHTIF